MATFKYPSTPLMQKEDAVFQGRATELHLFDDALAQSLDGSRPHVLAFAGMGGIGKSALARRFAYTLRKRAKAKDGEKGHGAVHAHIDLAEMGVDPVETLLQMRLQLGASAGDLPCPLFDMAFARYHMARYPSHDVRSHYGLMDPAGSIANALSRVSAAPNSDSTFLNDTADAINELIKDIPLVGFTYRLANKAFGWAAETWHAHGQALLADLGTVGADMVAARLPACLAMDLQLYLDAKRAAGKHEKPVAILCDTFEALTRDGNEVWLRDFITQCRGVLFVIMGREALTWAETDERPRWQEKWPAILNQQSLGALSRTDMEKLLAHYNVAEPDIATRMIDGADGIPFYLGLQLDMYRETRADGDTPLPEHYGGRRADVVRRFMDHIKSGYRTSLETLAFATRIDEDLDWFLRAEHPALARDLTFKQLRNYSFSEAINEKIVRLHQHMRDVLQERVQADDPQRAKAIHQALFDYYDPRCKPDDMKSITPDHEIALIEARHHLAYVDPKQAIGWAHENAEIFLEAARYKTTERVLNATLMLAQRICDDTSGELAKSYNALAVNLGRRGYYSEAEKLYRQALNRPQWALDEDPDLTATIITNIAGAIDIQGRYAEAEDFHLQAVDLYEQIYGVDHAKTATAYNNRAINLNHQDRHEAAEVQHHIALDIRKKVCGEDSLDTANSYNNLSSNFLNQKRYDEAEEFAQKAIQICVDRLGSTHPDTLGSYNNLASALTEQGQHKEAEKLYRYVLAQRKAVLVEYHPNLATSHNNLAGCLMRQRQYEEAEALLKKALTLVDEIFGPRHPTTVLYQENLRLCQEAIAQQTS